MIYSSIYQGLCIALGKSQGEDQMFKLHSSLYKPLCQSATKTSGFNVLNVLFLSGFNIALWKSQNRIKCSKSATVYISH